MDPIQTTNPQDNQQGWGFVPFGGNPPQPPVPTPVAPVSIPDPLDAQWGMPPFHFDESDFVIPASTPPAPWATDTSVPFGGTPAPVPVVAPVVDDNTASITPPTTIEIPPVATTDSTSPFAPRPDLEDDKPVQTTVETQTWAEPFATTTWFDLPSFDPTPTTSDTTNNDGWPFSLPVQESTVMTVNESDTTWPSFELPTIEQTPSATNDTDTSFDLPSFDTTPTTSDTTIPATIANASSVDLTSAEAPTPEVSPIVEMPKIEMPTVDTITEESLPRDTSNLHSDTPPMPTAPISEADNDSETENSDNILTTEENSSLTNLPISRPEQNDPQSSEFVSNTTESPISSAYSTFVEKLTQLLDLTKTESISLVGHHTTDEHINYEFSHDETESVIIKHHDLTADKSSTTHTLSIDHSDGLSVYLDDELLADYSDTNVAVDEQISYYINDKLQKFTLMIESEYERVNKKSKEDQEKKKKLLADLRAF